MNLSLHGLVALAVLLGSVCPASSLAQTGRNGAPLVEAYLVSGKLSDGEKKIRELLKERPEDDQARMSLAVLQFFQMIEHFGQGLYELGPRQEFAGSFEIGLPWNPFQNMSLPDNPNPQVVQLQDLHRLVQRMIDDLAQLDTTLAQIKSNDVKLPLRLFRFNLDINQDGRIGPAENLKSFYGQYLGDFPDGRDANRARRRRPEDIVVVFDRADVEWLRGYSSLLRGAGELFLAYDQTELWDVIASRTFKKPDIKYKFLLEEEKAGLQDINHQVLDLIASIHNARFPLKHADRVKKAQQHFKQTIAHSRIMWKLVNSETDNDREWLPSASQQAAITNIRITGRMTNTWGEFLDECQAILEGKKLIPFWRGKQADRGINLDKFFTNPREIDVVLWFHGAAALPYLETGEVTSESDWNRFQQEFGGELFGFAMWIN